MIPRVLRECSQWLVWKYREKKERNGKTRIIKMPYNPKNEKPAKVDDPTTWGTYTEACKVAYLYDGLGFVFTGNDPFVGIDIDHCIDENGHISDDAVKIMQQFDSYSEKSPSGTGLHIIITGSIKDGRHGLRRDSIEIYAQDRYFTVTGHIIHNAPVRDGQAAMDEIIAQIAPLQEKEKKPKKTRKYREDSESEGSPQVLRRSDEKLLKALFKQKNGDLLQALYNGEDAWTGDRSRDDLYFCWNINFRNGNDLEQTDRIFRASGRMRDKWDEVHWSDGTTYGQRTLARSYNKG